ncbi:hypothetical protein ODD08_004365 [Salmonella enterica]|nr:hypothetical protein [Salmonella enterica subsp. enterica serovar Oranienburg]EJX0634267.1 hypothetical protein [Salmonella enterica]
MVNTNVQQQEEIKAVCSSSAELCQQKYGYLVDQWDAFETTVKHMAADGTLPDEFRGYLSAVYHLGMEAEGTVAHYGWTERFEAMGFDKVTAGAMAATLPALVSGTKGTKANGIQNTYNSIKNAPLYPQGFRAVQNGTVKNTVNNKDVLSDLRAVEAGKWSKVYKDGYDAAGNKVSVHYFQSQSGKVFDVKVKSGWSNQK